MHTIVEFKFNFNYRVPSLPDGAKRYLAMKGSTADRANRESAGKKLSPRGQAARDKLKRAALNVMENVGFHRMRIHDVTAEAGVAAGLFYHYFPDLKSLTLEVLDDFIAESRNVELIERDVAKGDWYARMYAHFELVVSSYASRPGLMRCLLQMADEDEAFSARLRKHYLEQLNWLVELMPGLFPEARFDRQRALLFIYALASSGEMLLRDVFINRDQQLGEHALDQDALTELLTVIFYRGLFLKNPPAEKLKFTRALEFLTYQARS